MHQSLMKQENTFPGLEIPLLLSQSCLTSDFSYNDFESHNGLKFVLGASLQITQTETVHITASSRKWSYTCLRPSQIVCDKDCIIRVGHPVCETQAGGRLALLCLRRKKSTPGFTLSHRAAQQLCLGRSACFSNSAAHRRLWKRLKN